MNQHFKATRFAVGTLLTAALGVASASEPVVGKIVSINGQAVVSQGAGYVVGSEGMPLRNGDRILALEGGSAVLQFEDGCQYTLSDAEVLNIGTQSACAAKASASDAVAQSEAKPYAAVSQESPTEVSESFQKAALAAPAGASLAWVPVAAGGVVAIAAATNVGGNNDNIKTQLSPE